jgi:hypothetical protein
VAEPADVSRCGWGADACPRARGRSRSTVRLIGVLLLAGVGVGACSIPFGPGSGDPSVGTTEDTGRERNQRYQQEQQLMEQQRQFDRVGPSDR